MQAQLNHLTAQPGGAQPASDWRQFLDAQKELEEARAKGERLADNETEVLQRTYVLSPKRNPEKKYDNRLHERLDCGKTKAYELLQAFERGEEGGLEHYRVGNKYIVTEPAVREFQRSFGGMRVSHRKA